MTENNLTDIDIEIAARLLARDGLTVNDIASQLRTHPAQVKAWISPEKAGPQNDDEKAN